MSNNDNSHKEEIELKVKIGHIQHAVHVDKDLTWNFDHKVDPNTIFREIKEIAHDDCGTVYELVHTPSNTPIVGKTAIQTIFDSSTMSKIVSQFIIRYYGSIILNSSLTFLMEFYSNGSVRDIIDKRKTVLTESQTSFILQDLLCALNVLHSKH